MRVFEQRFGEAVQAEDAKALLDIANDVRKVMWHERWQPIAEELIRLCEQKARKLKGDP